MKNPLPFMNCILWTITTAITIRLLMDGQYLVGSITSLIVVISGIRTWRRFVETIFKKEKQNETLDEQP